MKGMAAVMDWVLPFCAAACFAVGGIFMKYAEGVARLLPTLAYLALFTVGAVLQAQALRRADLGVVYIVVLGLEAALALAFSILLFREGLSPARVTAVVLILVGVALLRRD